MSEQPENQQQAPSFLIQKLYVTDVSLESPSTPAAFLEQNQPQVDVQFRNQAKNYDNGFFEVSLKATIQAKHEETVLFLVEVTQAGLFVVNNIAEEDLGPLLGIACPTILLPYLREAVSDLTARAGFPPFVLQPVNFEDIYLQQVAQAQAEAQENEQANA